MADIRKKEGVLEDDAFLLEDPSFLFPEEIKQKQRKSRRTSGFTIVGEGQDEHVAVKQENGLVLVFLRLPVYELEGVKRGLK